MVILTSYADASILLDLIFNTDRRLVYTRAPCSTYPPTARMTAFNGLEKVVIRLTCGGASLSPTIIKVAIGMHANRVLLYPFHKILLKIQKKDASGFSNSCICIGSLLLDWV